MKSYIYRHIETDAWLKIKAKTKSSSQNVINKITKKPTDWKLSED